MLAHEVRFENWPISRLVEYERNPRKNDHAVDQMAKAIVEFEFRIPIVAHSNGLVVDGHLRLKAARQLGLEIVPVVLADDLSETQIKAFRVAVNQSAHWAEWDEPLLAEELLDLEQNGYNMALLGFPEDQLDRLLASNAAMEENADLAHEDVVPDPPLQPVSRPGDLWLLGEHRLLCGDSTKADDVARVMHGRKAVLFATDPPYLVDYDGTNHPSKKNAPDKNRADKNKADKNKDWGNSYGITWDDSSQGPELYEAFIKAAIDNAILPNAAWYCWHASRRQAMLEEVWEKAGAFVHQQIVWTKDRGILTRSHYLWKHEPCFFGWLKGNKPPRVSDDYPTTVWELPTVKVGEKTDHPTSKPIDVFAIPMRQHAKAGEVCYEPFSGSGSQIIAGETTGRRVYAIEISPQYVDVGVSRWQTGTGREAILDGDGRTFAEVKAERLAQDPADPAAVQETNAAPRPARKRKTAA